MKIFINDAKEDWIVDRLKKEYSEYNPELFTNEAKDADIIWIISPWSWKNVSKKYLKEKQVLCTVHHVDFNKFTGKEKRNFYKLDKFVDYYHTISDKSYEQLFSITSKKIYNFPFWVNSKLWFDIPESSKLKKKYKIEYIYYEKVSFEELNELYNCLDLYIVSSRVEGGPQSIFECGLSKTPIISTNVGDISDIITDRFNGILINDFSNRNHFFEISSIIEDSERYNFYSNNARESIKKYYSSNSLTKWESVLDSYI